MKAAEIQNRRKQITEILYEKQEVKVTDLLSLFGVSDETIRKDLAYLEEEGIVKKKYGGATLIKQERLDPVGNRTPIDFIKKSALVDAAFSLIPEAPCSIGLDQGSTVALLAQKIQRFDNKQIFTGSLASILELTRSKNKIYCLGGKYSFEDMAFQNDPASDLYPDIQLDICFFGSSGVKNRTGFCTSSLTDAKLKRKLCQKSLKKIVLLDSTKFQHSSLVQAVSWDEVDMVITNDSIPEKDRALIAQQTQLLIV